MSKTTDAAIRSQIGRYGAYSRQAKHDTRQTTKSARDTWDEHFIDEVDPDRTLAPKERDHRVKAARKAHYTHPALMSAQARRARKSSEREVDQ